MVGILRASRVALVVLAAALPWANPRATAIAAPPVQAMFVPADRRTATLTPYVTDRSKVYTVTVTGVWSYNGRAGFADCGHHDPEDAKTWVSDSAPLVDGIVSPCSSMPVSPVHEYQWTQLGTGARLSFLIAFGQAPSDDNLGGLVVVVSQGS